MSKSPKIKNQVFKVAFCNTAGELDSVVVLVPESYPGECKIKIALLALVQSINHFDHGDSITVVQIS